MALRLTSLIETARAPSVWDFGNEVLYSLCREHPHHLDVPTVIAKVWLIGRAYAAAIERRKVKETDNDNFYVDKVGPDIRDSDIDRWIATIPDNKSDDTVPLSDIVTIHSKVTLLFSRISGLEKRSLASKYLHFHRPLHFFIYDTRAVEGMRKLSSFVGRASSRIDGDSEYRKFAEKCLRLQTLIREQHGVALSPRQVDNLLLAAYETESEAKICD